LFICPFYATDALQLLDLLRILIGWPFPNPSPRFAQDATSRKNYDQEEAKSRDGNATLSILKM
jgi:hypothetical protein